MEKSIICCVLEFHTTWLLLGTFISTVFLFFLNRFVCRLVLSFNWQRFVPQIFNRGHWQTFWPLWCMTFVSVCLSVKKQKNYEWNLHHYGRGDMGRQFSSKGDILFGVLSLLFWISFSTYFYFLPSHEYCPPVTINSYDHCRVGIDIPPWIINWTMRFSQTKQIKTQLIRPKAILSIDIRKQSNKNTHMAVNAWNFRNGTTITWICWGAYKNFIMIMIDK